MRMNNKLAILAAAIGFSTAIPSSTFMPTASAATASGAVAKSALGRRLPEVKFDNISLGDAIDFIRDISAANIVVNWRALAEQNVTKDTAINVRLNGVSLRKVLNTVLSEAGAGNTLTYVVDDDVIEITTQQLADQQTYIRIYNIEDLLMEIPNFDNAPDFDLTQQGSSGGGSGGGQGGGGGGQGNSLFGQSGNSSKKDEKVKTKDERAQDIVDLIVNTIRPEIWKDNGGTASIKYFNGNLVISAPLSVHEMIGG